jgi:hypothetical protein
VVFAPGEEPAERTARLLTLLRAPEPTDPVNHDLVEKTRRRRKALTGQAATPKAGPASGSGIR